MKKVILVVCIAIVSAVALAFVFKDVIARNVIVRGFESVTGAPMEMGSVRFSFGGAVEAKGIKLFNPGSYSDRLMADIPEFTVTADIPQFLKGKVHLSLLKLSLKEIAVVRDAKGALNVDSLRALQPKGSGPAPQIAIDLVQYSVGKVTYRDYQLGITKEFDVNLSDSLSNVTDPMSLVKVILSKALKSTSIPELANLDVKGLKEAVKTNAIKKLKGSLEKLIP